MSYSFTPPTVNWAWPTGNRLLDRLSLPRGLTVITDGLGGWTNVEFPYLGSISGLTEGSDYFLGGHVYLDIDSNVALSLIAHGYTVEQDGVNGTFPSLTTFPSSLTFPAAA